MVMGRINWLFSWVSYVAENASALYISRGGWTGQVLQQPILPPLPHNFPPFLKSPRQLPNSTEMDSFFTFFTPSETPSTEQQDFPVEFETGGGTSGGGCVIA